MIMKNAGILLQDCKDIGLEINTDETKFVNDIMYFGTTITSKKIRFIIKLYKE
jgi:hypothetical protein